jgi:crotonobetaine/carnitine-CoA ligase
VTYLSVPALLVAAAETFGSAPALVTSRGTESFADLLRHTTAAAAAIRRRGAGPGDRVLIAAGNSPAAVHAWLGAIYAGAVPAAVNPDLTGPEMAYLVQDLKPSLTLNERGVAGLRGGRGGIDPHAADPLEPAAIVYTSGTTSRPKGVLVRHAAYTEAGRAFPSWVGLGAEERLWACLPLFHINAQAYSVMTALAHGHSLALTAKFHASSFWRDARALGVTSVNVVGAMLAMLERQPAASWVESSLRTIYAAPAPATPAARSALEERFRVRIAGGYGMSENPFGCAETATSRAKAACIGRPRQPAADAFVNELRVVEPESGRDAETGKVGELWFRNPVLTPGYWNAPEITERTLAEGWLHTGDAGYVDADGDVFLSGRYKEMIRRRGENIAPAEVEAALLSHAAVAAAAAFGVPSELTDDDVVAAVVLSPESSAGEDELRQWAGRSLARFKVPSRIVFRDSLPMTATQRVAKDVLREEFLKKS